MHPKGIKNILFTVDIAGQYKYVKQKMDTKQRNVTFDKKRGRWRAMFEPRDKWHEIMYSVNYGHDS